MSWLKHYLKSFKKTSNNEDKTLINCIHRLNYEDGLILCHHLGIQSIETCKKCKYKERG